MVTGLMGTEAWIELRKLSEPDQGERIRCAEAF